MSLIAWYPLNGDLNDYSGNNYTLTASSGISVDNNGKIGKCYDFDPLGGSVLNTAPVTQSTESMTITMWVFYRDYTYPKSFGMIKRSAAAYFTGISNRGWDFGHGYKNNGVDIAINDGVNLIRSTLVFDVGSRPPDLLNKWTHLTYVIDRNLNIAYSYVNGVRQSANLNISSITGTITDPNRRIDIGGMYGWKTDGKLNDVRVYNHVLSTKEIKELAKAKVLHYTFNDFQEPTTNLVGDPMFLTSPIPTNGNSGTYGNWVFDTWTSDIHEIVSINGINMLKITGSTTVGSNDFWSLNWRDSVPISTTHTISFFAMGVGTITFNSHWGGVLQTIVLTETLTRYSITTTKGTQSGQYGYVACGGLNQGQYLIFSRPQLEIKSYSTEFTLGTRTGIVRDISGYNNSNTLVESTTPRFITDSMLGSGGYKFNGTNSSIPINTIFTGQDFSVFAWVRPLAATNGRNNVVTNGYPYQLDKGWFFSFQSNNAFFISIGRDNAYAQSAGGVITNGQWNFIGAKVVNGGESFQLYLNGLPISSPVGILSSRNITYQDTTSFIGKRNTEQYRGDIDDIRIYNTALSDADVLELYQTRAQLDDRGNLNIGEVVEYNTIGNISAKRILDSGKSTGNGVYNIQPKGLTFSLPIYCDMTSDGGGWMRVFYHNIVNGTVLFASNAEAIQTNINSPTTSNKYSILSYLEYFRNTGKSFEFRLFYPGLSNRNIWRQSSNPTFQPVSGYEPISITWTGNFWGGLEYNGGNDTFIDGSVNHSNWWYSIGSKVSFSGGIPGPNSTVVQIVELYVREVDNLPISIQPSGIANMEVVSEVGITDGLTRYWKLNGDVRDYSGNNGNATNNGAILSSGLKDMSYSFNGTISTWINSNYGINLNPFTNPLTISLWVKSNDTVPQQIVFSSGQDVDSNLRLYIGQNAGKWDIGILTSSWGSGTVNVTTNWAFLTLVMNSGTASLYVDNVLSRTINYISYTLPRNFHIGKHDNSFYYNGKITDVRIYDRVLSQEEILIQYKYGLPSTGMQMSASGTLYLNSSINEGI